MLSQHEQIVNTPCMWQKNRGGKDVGRRREKERVCLLVAEDVSIPRREKGGQPAMHECFIQEMWASCYLELLQGGGEEGLSLRLQP